MHRLLAQVAMLVVALGLGCTSGAPPAGPTIAPLDLSAQTPTTTRATGQPTPALASTATVAGFVTLLNGTPLAGATVSVQDPAAGTDRTDGKGFYEIDQVPPGTYFLQVSSASAVSEKFQFKVQAGQALNINPQLQALTPEELVRINGPVPMEPVAPIGPIVLRVRPGPIVSVVPVVPSPSVRALERESPSNVRTIASPRPSP
jgi:hypothetical protein